VGTISDRCLLRVNFACSPLRRAKGKARGQAEAAGMIPDIEAGKGRRSADEPFVNFAALA
jgi:hypothetical protein